MAQQKLYTEEQVREMLQVCQDSDLYEDILTFDDILKTQISIELPSDEELAILFHNKYEELAPKFKYETKIETKKFNKDSNNGKLMIAVCKQILEILNQNK